MASAKDIFNPDVIAEEYAKAIHELRREKRNENGDRLVSINGKDPVSLKSAIEEIRKTGTDFYFKNGKLEKTENHKEKKNISICIWEEQGYKSVDWSDFRKLSFLTPGTCSSVNDPVLDRTWDDLPEDIKKKSIQELQRDDVPVVSFGADGKSEAFPFIFGTIQSYWNRTGYQVDWDKWFFDEIRLFRTEVEGRQYYGFIISDSDDRPDKYNLASVYCNGKHVGNYLDYESAKEKGFQEEDKINSSLGRFNSVLWAETTCDDLDCLAYDYPMSRLLSGNRDSLFDGDERDPSTEIAVRAAVFGSEGFGYDKKSLTEAIGFSNYCNLNDIYEFLDRYPEATKNELRDAVVKKINDISQEYNLEDDKNKYLFEYDHGRFTVTGIRDFVRDFPVSFITDESFKKSFAELKEICDDPVKARKAYLEKHNEKRAETVRRNYYKAAESMGLPKKPVEVHFRIPSGEDLKYKSWFESALDSGINYLTVAGEDVEIRNNCVMLSDQFGGVKKWNLVSGESSLVKLRDLFRPRPDGKIDAVVNDKIITIDGASVEQEGFHVIKKDGKFNYVNENGDLLTDKWFDRASLFKKGKATVERDGQTAVINTKGYVEEVRGLSKLFAKLR